MIPNHHPEMTYLLNIKEELENIPKFAANSIELKHAYEDILPKLNKYPEIFKTEISEIKSTLEKLTHR